MVRHLILPLLLLFSAPALAQPPLQAVPELDLARYAGTWHEIARLPMYFERRCARAITATYPPRHAGTPTGQLHPGVPATAAIHPELDGAIQRIDVDGTLVGSSGAPTEAVWEEMKMKTAKNQVGAPLQAVRAHLQLTCRAGLATLLRSAVRAPVHVCSQMRMH